MQVQACTANEVLQLLQLPPVALNTNSTPTKSATENIWNASVSGQPWGNGEYQVKTSSIWTVQESQMWQLFDYGLIQSPHFALNDYSTSTGYFKSSLYSLDGSYYGESLYLISHTYISSLYIYIHIYIVTTLAYLSIHTWTYCSNADPKRFCDSF
jgi:hypothetical protein